VTVNKVDFWGKVLAILRAGEPCALLCVVESVGSSPGRAGFKMAVTSKAMHGSIGGGSMEHKLVELARSHLAAGSSVRDPAVVFPFLKRQIHQPGIGQDRSGMICSGEQTVAFFLLTPAHASLCVDVVHAMDAGATKELLLSSKGISIVAGSSSRDPAEEEAMKEPEEAGGWRYREAINAQPRIVIIGAGHVGLALSRSMTQLGFHVHLMDDRTGLNTMEDNAWAQKRSVVDYATIGDVITEDEELYVVLVSFGYRTDEILLRQLVRKRFKYLGMLGSSEKTRKLFADMKVDGFTEAELAPVHAPIGLPINSRTPEEIAVSIAAEIIAVKNAATTIGKTEPATNTGPQ